MDLLTSETRLSHQELLLLLLLENSSSSSENARLKTPVPDKWIQARVRTGAPENDFRLWADLAQNFRQGTPSSPL